VIGSSGPYQPSPPPPLLSPDWPLLEPSLLAPAMPPDDVEPVLPESLLDRDWPLLEPPLLEPPLLEPPLLEPPLLEPGCDELPLRGVVLMYTIINLPSIRAIPITMKPLTSPALLVIW
jgi:hypothetical protein